MSDFQKFIFHKLLIGVLLESLRQYYSFIFLSLSLLIDKHYITNIIQYRPFFYVKLLHFFFLFLSGFSFTTIHESRDCRGRGRAFLNSSLPHSPASQTVRNQAGDYCRELTCAYRLQPDSNRKPLVTKHQSLTTKLRENIVSRKFTDTFSQSMEKFLKM